MNRLTRFAVFMWERMSATTKEYVALGIFLVLIGFSALIGGAVGHMVSAKNGGSLVGCFIAPLLTISSYLLLVFWNDIKTSYTRFASFVRAAWQDANEKAKNDQ